MALARDLTGQAFGRLTVVELTTGRSRTGDRLYLCACSCGSESIVPTSQLTRGRTKSCGCLRLKHGMVDSPEYTIWAAMKYRCENPRNQNYENYGGRGIKVCREWMESFDFFFRDMGPRPSSKHTLERKNNDGDYSFENCCWATQREQSNNKRTNHMLEHDGESDTLANWARRLKLNESTLRVWVWRHPGADLALFLAGRP